MKKNIINILVVVIFISGISVLLYPIISNKLSEKEQLSVITDYKKSVSKLDDDQAFDEMKKAVDYNNSLKGDPVKDPYVSGSGNALPDNYLSVLDVNDDGIMGYIKIPKINVSLPIYHGVAEEVISKGAGHIQQTALPIGGLGNHSVIVGHTGLPTSKLFTDVKDLEIGDVFYIYVINEILAYEVDDIQVILPEDLDCIQPQKDKDLVTLITCTPYGINSHRLLVRGSRVEYEETDDATTMEEIFNPENLKITKYIICGTVLFVLILVILIIIFKKRKEKDKEYEGVVTSNEETKNS